MDFIIDFYNSLETLDLIIFWGIIIVIILLLIFALILINKNKKLKKFIVNTGKNKNEDNYNQEIPIKKTISIPNELTNDNQHLNNQNNNTQEEIVFDKLCESPKIIDKTEQSNNNHIELEKDFIAEEHIMELNKELSNKQNHMEEKNFEKKVESPIKHNHKIEMPTGPYQRNVLREMSLSQTSPIGLTSPKRKDDKKIELAKDLDESLNFENNEKFIATEENYQQTRNKNYNQKDKLEEYQLIKEQSKKENNQINRNEDKKDTLLIHTEKRIYQEEKEKNKVKTNEKLSSTYHDESTQAIKKQTDDIKKIEKPNYNDYQDKKTLQDENKVIKEELRIVDNYSPRKTEIIGSKTDDNSNKYERNKLIKEYQMIDKTKQENIDKLGKKHLEQQQLLQVNESISNNYYASTREEKNVYQQEPNKFKNEVTEERITEANVERQKDNIDPRVRELLNSVSKPLETETTKSSSEKYLEEVSRKLAEAEIPDEIERTDYELEQEENAIISYKELMEKKDSIQTIDEEEAIISIEELMNRSKNKEENNSVKEDNKLYNLTEEEENDDFIKELKQFRSDL